MEDFAYKSNVSNDIFKRNAVEEREISVCTILQDIIVLL